MASRRTSTLNGVKAAKELHDRLRTRAALGQGFTRVDVFRAVVDAGAFLLFRPLDGPLGLYIDEPAPGVFRPGILVSTKRELHTQRFTGAHELGHLVMGHQTSIDTQPLGLWRSGSSSDPQEVEADAFATEFLLPRWLYQHHAERHGWTRKRLGDPNVVYQLSLRMGASYDATCWGLLGHDLITRSMMDRLLAHEPKSLKRAALGDIALSNPWANVWVVDESDSGLELEGGPDDVFVLRLIEHAASGYLWNETRLSAAGLEILADRREPPAEIGDPVVRVLVARVREPASFDLEITERRPWLTQAAPLKAVTLTMNLHGKEFGLPRVQRRALAA
ncbi:ImmA/IrrE family metallo-endopeptidase [Sorangium sp. So ce1182]|uniref:ImmA/IrrE family metallo-endopeptidase n=1 Tax=Sorangium sp. So ce1182 TaxID=3133334 RepID=UPI003F5E42E8